MEKEGKKERKRKEQGNESRFVAASPIFLAGNGRVCRPFEDEQTRPDYDRKANKKIRKPFRRFGSRRRVQRVYRYRYIYICIGSRRPEVAGQLISHFFDEDSRNSRCSLCRDTSSNNGELLRIAATTRTHCRESYVEERKRGRVK